MLDSVKEKIKENVKSDERPDALLTNTESEYNACLEVKENELQELFAKDHLFW